MNGVTWSSKDNVVKAIGKTEDLNSSPTKIRFSVPKVPGIYRISGGNDKIKVVVQIEKASGGYEYYVNNRTFTVVDEDVSVELYLQVDKNKTVNDSVKVMLNKGNVTLAFEPYTGGTPYTDKYTATITDQTGDSVTLSIKNVSESVGNSTELDVMLTDRNGVTKRSEQGKKFIGG